MKTIFGEPQDFKVYIGDKTIATATSCTLECQEPQEQQHEWSNDSKDLSFSFNVENPGTLPTMRLMYCINDWLEFHDQLVRKFWYAYKMTYL